MKQEFLLKVKNKQELLIITDQNGNVICKTEVSPVSGFYTAYFEEKINSEKVIVYANQLGIALALASNKLDIIEYNAFQVSEPAKEIIEGLNITINYEEVIDLVKSSKNQSMVCPVEQFLFDNTDRIIQEEFINNKYNKQKETEAACNT